MKKDNYKKLLRLIIKNIDYLVNQFNDGMFGYANFTCDKQYKTDGNPLYKRVQGNAILTKHKINNLNKNFIITN